MSEAGSAAGREAVFRPLILYLLFVLSGVGLVLPGTLMPFLARSGWHDGRSGVLFLLFFVGSTAGAFCARGRLGRMLLVASAAVAFPTALFPALSGILFAGSMLLSGFGLGLVMTAVTLLRSRQVPDRRAAELTRLNLVWAAGAASAPFVLLRSTACFGLSPTLRAYAAAVLLCGCAASVPLWRETVPDQGRWAAWRRLGGMSAGFAICLPLSTGIEAGVGAWLVTYTLRGAHTYTSIVSAGTALWFGLLLSRFLFSGSRASFLRGRYTTVLFAGVLIGGLLLLLWAGAAWALVAGAFGVGFGVGPIYPEVLARSLAQSEAGNAAFLLAGTGSALLPFLIGEVSQQAHSLRTGLTVPLVGALVLLAGLLHLQRPAARVPTG